MTLADNVPIFSKIKKDFTPSYKVTHVVLENRYLVAALANGSIFRMHLQSPNTRDGKIA